MPDRRRRREGEASTGSRKAARHRRNAKKGRKGERMGRDGEGEKALKLHVNDLPTEVLAAMLALFGPG